MLAVELGRRGIRCLLVDPKPGTAFNPQANATQARTMEHFRCLGFTQEIRAKGLPSGRLVPVLDDWDLPRLSINLAYPSRKHLSAKVRTFIDFMVEHFARMNYEQKWTGRFGVD